MRDPRPPRKPMTLYPKPKKLRDYPKYIAKVIRGFFSRLFYVISLLWQTSPALLVLMVLLCVAAGVLPVASAVVGKYLLNAVNGALLGTGLAPGETLLHSVWGTLSTVGFFILLQFIFLLVRRLVNRLQTAVNTLAGERVSSHIRLMLMNQAKKVDLASFDNPDFYEKLENANREAGMRPIGILSSTFSVISYIISAVSFVTILVTVGWQIPLFVLLFSLPAAVVNYVYRRRGYWYMRRASKERRQMSYFSDVVTDKDLAKEVRLMHSADTFIDKYKTAFGTYYKGIRRLTMAELFWQIGVGIFSLAAEAAVFFYIAYHVVSGNMEIGDYSLYSGALTSIGSYVSSVIASTATVYEGTLFIDNLMTFMREKPSVVATHEPPRVPRHGVPHTLVCEDISLRYPGSEQFVLRHFSCEMKSGDRIVLVGLNGAGKTTLIKLLTRLYDPTEGRITLDGHDLREYDPEALYALYGTVFQDFGKYAVTAGENIALGNTRVEKDTAAVRRAAEMGDASGFIERLPADYDTPHMRYFEEDATELSQGQWQKLSVARAFYADSDILILDEPTAALDAIAEEEVYRRFATLSENKLTLLVSHRLSCAVSATRILVLSDGTLAESGTHRELMEKGGIYYHLFSTQAKHYLPEENPDSCI